MRKINKVFLIVFSCFSLFFITDKAYADGYVNDRKFKVIEGIKLENESLSGLEEKELTGKLDQYMSGISNYKLHLSLAEDEEKQVEFKMKELKLEPLNTDILNDVVRYGNRGNLLQKLSQRKEIAGNGLNLEARASVAEDTVRTLVDKVSKKLNIKAKDGSLRRENGDFIIEPGIVGHELDKETAVSNILTFVNEQWDANSDINLKLSSQVTTPKGTMEELSKVKDLIGTATTTYSAGGNRGMNLANGAKKINGSLIYPGEVFSVYEAVQPFNKENGYYLAGSYENGTVVSSYGGGICQVSSTLYNAALAAEMDIVERSAHSMIVTYLEPSKDAAISGTYKDLKFKNNSEYPIYIEGYANAGKLKFDIYGYENRPNDRKVRYVSEVTSTTPAGVKYVEVNQPIGYKKVVQGAHIGHTARLVKVVTENGEEKREVINNSTYRASPKIIEIGVKSDVEGASEAIKAAIKSKDDAAVDTAVSTWKNKKKDEKKEEENKTDKKENTQNTDTTTDDEDDWTDGSE